MLCGQPRIVFFKSPHGFSRPTVCVEACDLIFGNAFIGIREETDGDKHHLHGTIFFLEEILKDCYAENFFNKLILQTFKG